VTIIIMVANRRTSSELAPDAPHFIQRNPATYVAGLGFMEAERFQDFDRLVEQQQSCRDSEKSSPTRRTTE
jgi:hypothetical protein